MTLTDEQIEEIKARAEAATPGAWRLYALSLKEQDVDFLDHCRDDIPALLSALEAEKKRADEAEARRKCYECGSEMTACARCNPELPTAELTALRARVAELEEVLTDALFTMNHARVFIRSREKMHPDGQALYVETEAKIDAALKEKNDA